MGFHEWHIEPVNFRKYGIYIIDYLNKDEMNLVIEVGCGIGEIIGNCRAKERRGYDIERCVIEAAKKVYRKTQFYVGSMENIRNLKIDCLITVNWIHSMETDELISLYLDALKNNQIKEIILDVICNDSSYIHNHDIDYIARNLEMKKKRIGSGRTIRGVRVIYSLKK